MSNEWSVFTPDLKWSGSNWAITFAKTINVRSPLGSTRISYGRAGDLKLRRRFIGWHLFKGQQRIAKLRRVPRDDIKNLKKVLRITRLHPVLSDILIWFADLMGTVEEAMETQRWIPRETRDRLIQGQPQRNPTRILTRHQALPYLSPEMIAALESLDADLPHWFNDLNQQILDAELVSQKHFLDTIEKTPLSPEQAEAVICFDNRVQLLAGAGSGKTSVMVARAAYAASRGFVRPNRILMLAFNKAAAEELQDRINTRFAAAGITSKGVRASTFHAFGLDLIGRTTGEKPRLAPWLDKGNEMETILQIVDDLRDSSEDFRFKWDLYRTIFATAPTDINSNKPDAWDSETKVNGYQTYQGDVVRSHGERMIANYMFMSGITYEYERQYTYRTASATHGQYRPDFYYPDVDVWHEHWALDANGQPPESFHGYLDSMEWKRNVHASNRTTLVESTWASVVFGNGLADLQDDLESHGLTFDLDPERPIPNQWAKMYKHEELARLIRTFMSHVKSNGLTQHDVETAHARLPNSHPSHGYRSRLFLDIYWPVHNEWERRLAADGYVDFEDMLVHAATLLESGHAESDYDLILVDEFQDASQARARLVRGLVQDAGKYLLAVGDDWQAINRFAGADISVMRDFEQWFGASERRSLTMTFRCPQTICDVATRFISKNPSQLPKEMNSTIQEPHPFVRIVEGDTKESLIECLDNISEKLSKERATVQVLARYNFHRASMPSKTPKNLDVEFRTIHSAKGLEADYVIVIGLDAGTYGFPSEIVDDPVLALAMPTAESFQHAEERRMFYVAITRARREAILIAPPRGVSPFVVELLTDPSVENLVRDGEPVRPCPECGQGVIVERSGPRGTFHACSTFPACLYTENRSSTSTSPSRSQRTNRSCPQCVDGHLVKRKGKYGQFFGCSSYPRCRYTQNLS